VRARIPNRTDPNEGKLKPRATWATAVVRGSLVSRSKTCCESTLAIFVAEVGALVERLRQRYDRSAAVRMPAHITLIYPFLPGQPVDAQTIDQLRVLFSRFPPLRFSLIEARQFLDTVYMAPHPDGPFMELIQAVVARGSTSKASPGSRKKPSRVRRED